MNYPAYVATAPGTEQSLRGLGLGYTYSADQVAPLNGEAFVDGADARRKLTDIAYSLCVGTWAEQHPAGRFFFGIGGVNTVNPFAAIDVGFGSIKNEPGVYGQLFASSSSLPSALPRMSDLPPPCQCGAIYDTDGEEVADVPWDAYDDVYMDFNGSMAFLENAAWRARLEQLAPLLRGVFVQGGVRADGHEATTLPAVPGFLNRLSCATMNQLYAPAGTAAFFDFLHANRAVPCYVVTNNAVADLADDDVDHSDAAHTTGTPGLARMRAFLVTNGLVPGAPGAPSFLWEAAVRYYTTKAFRAPRKAFDYYTAVALLAAVARAPLPLPAALQVLFYDATYGVALLAAAGTTDPAEAIALHVRGLRRKEETAAAEFSAAATPRLLAVAAACAEEVTFFEEATERITMSLRALDVREVAFVGADGAVPLSVAPV
jgi:hypothetical protein